MSARNALSLLLFSCCTAHALRASVVGHIGRRAALSTAAGLAVSNTLPPSAADAAAATAARVAAYPPLEYLEPIYELKLSLDALGSIAGDSARWPALQKRLDKFFSGGLLSEKSYYIGLAVQYSEKIAYDDLAEFVKSDKQQRLAAMEDTLAAMETTKIALASPGPDVGAIVGSTGAAQRALARWLSLVPPSDVDRVDKLFKAVRVADADRNGKLSKEEAASLSAEDRATWQARVALVGD